MRHLLGRVSLLVACSVLMAQAAQAQQGLTPYQPAPPPPITGFPGMTNDQVQQIMANSRKIQQCLATDAKEPLRRVQKRSRENSATVDALCKAGKPDEAKETAARLAEDLARSDDMAAIRKCSGEGMKKAEAARAKQEKLDAEKHHVCDYLK